MKLNIENVGTDLDTLAGIILEEDEEYSQDSTDEDQELTDMRHQLFEVHWIWCIWMSIFMKDHIPLKPVKSLQLGCQNTFPLWHVIFPDNFSSFLLT